MAHHSAQALEQFEGLCGVMEVIREHSAQQHTQRAAGQPVDVAAAGAHFRHRLQVRMA